MSDFLDVPAFDGGPGVFARATDAAWLTHAQARDAQQRRCSAADAQPHARARRRP